MVFRWSRRDFGFRKAIGQQYWMADGFGRKFCGAEAAGRMFCRAGTVGGRIIWVRSIIIGLLRLVGRPGGNFGCRRRLSGFSRISQAFDTGCKRFGTNQGRIPVNMSRLLEILRSCVWLGDDARVPACFWR